MSETLPDLYRRRAICVGFINILTGHQDDPRGPGALEHYRAQCAEIDKKITELEAQGRRERGEPEPEPIVISLQPATLTAKGQ